MRSQKGVTLVALVTSIIIIFIIATVAAYSGMEAYRNMSIQNFVAKMKVIQEKVDLIYDDYKNWDKYGIDETGDEVPDYNINNYITETFGINKISNANDYPKLSAIISEIDNYSSSTRTSWTASDKILTNYFYFTSEKLESILGLKDLDMNVIINFATRNVISDEGVYITDNEKRYRQYDLPGGQQLIPGENPEVIVNIEPSVIENNGLTKKVRLSTGGAMTSKIRSVYYGISSDDSRNNIESWQDATKLPDYTYDEVHNIIIFTLNVSGKYFFRIDDSTNKTYYSENVLDVTLVNPPKLAEGMIPIKYVEDKWVICSPSDPQWYNYTDTSTTGLENKSYWANVMLSDGIYKTSLVNYNPGITEVQESELGSMFVWIPRYAYRITSGYHSTGAVGSGPKIEVQFLSQTSLTPTNYKSTVVENSEYVAGAKDTSMYYFLHPAFQDGRKIGYQNGEWDKELTGIWVAKFESSAAKPDTLEHVHTSSRVVADAEPYVIRVIPSKSSWRFIKISDSYMNCINMLKVNNNIYGVKQNTIDSHLMKNSEWGAVTYLAHSKYGLNGTKITINANSNYTTGGGNYSTTNVSQSTTGNVYGIYDLSGSAYEKTAAYIANGNYSLLSYGWSDIITVSVANPTNRSTKYLTVYSHDAVNSEAGNYDANKIRYGNGIYETSANGSSSLAWLGGRSIFPKGDYPFLVRGGFINSGVNAGLFCFDSSNGDASVDETFRPVLVML